MNWTEELLHRLVCILHVRELSDDGSQTSSPIELVGGAGIAFKPLRIYGLCGFLLHWLSFLVFILTLFFFKLFCRNLWDFFFYLNRGLWFSGFVAWTLRDSLRVAVVRTLVCQI